MSGGVRAELRNGAELLALTGLAVTQPVLDVLGDSPETFVFRDVDGGQIVVFALLLAVGPALVVWSVGLLSGLLGERVRRGVQVASVGVLAGTAVLVALRLADVARGGAVLVLAVGAGVVAAALYLRLAAVRLFLLYLAPLPLLAAGLFLFSSSVSDLVRGADIAVVEDVDADRPVVMLLLDEFPTASLLDAEGDIDAAEFPNLARLSRQGTWFRNYTTHNASTVQAVPSVLSGSLPERGRTPLVTDWPDNLFTLLGGTYEMAVQETVTRLCPPDVCRNEGRTVTQRTALDPEGLSGVFDDAGDVFRQLVSLEAEHEVQVDAFAEEVVSVPAPTDFGEEMQDEVTTQPARFADFLAGLVPSEDPTLHFVHLILPHGPWRFFPDGTEYRSPFGDPEGEIAGVWTSSWPAELSRLRLQMQAAYTDALVGQTVDRLQESGLWEEALFVVVSDHGGSFLVDQPGRAITTTNLHEVMWTPLFIHAPGLAPGRDDTDVEASDLLPTLADLLGFDLPFPSDGVSVLDPADPSGTKRYQRIQNPFQPEPDALLSVDAANGLRRLLAADWPSVDPDDPVGAFYRTHRLGALYGRSVADLDVTDDADAAVELDRLDELTEGTDGPLPAYLGGQVTDGRGRWVVVALDGVVRGYSALFPMVDTDRAFSVLFDQDMVTTEGHDVEVFLTDGPGGPLRPAQVS